MKQEKNLGQIGYEAYCAFSGWKSLVTGQHLPAWEAVKPEIQQGWAAAAKEIIAQAPGLILTAAENPMIDSLSRHVTTLCQAIDPDGICGPDTEKIAAYARRMREALITLDQILAESDLETIAAKLQEVTLSHLVAQRKPFKAIRATDASSPRDLKANAAQA